MERKGKAAGARGTAAKRPRRDTAWAGKELCVLGVGRALLSWGVLSWGRNQGHLGDGLSKGLNFDPANTGELLLSRTLR